MNKITKIYPSSSAFMHGRMVFTSYDSGCLRKIMLDAAGFKQPITSASSSIGATNEARFEQQLIDAGNTTYRREDSVSVPISDDGSVVLSGRRDFVVDLPDGSQQVVELKGTQSKNKYQMMRENRYTVENLAQVVAYMVASEIKTGRLIYSFYKKPDDPPTLVRDYLVTISDFGDILVDGKVSGHTVNDYLTHRAASVDAIVNGTVYDRPFNYDAKFGSPCAYCPFKNACDLYEFTTGGDLFTAASKIGLTPSVNRGKTSPSLTPSPIINSEDKGNATNDGSTQV